MTKRMSSILDGYPVPPEFDEYCLKLLRTKEIDSVKKLKDFWLYAIEVGKKYGPEYRESIAMLATEVAASARIPHLKVSWSSDDIDIAYVYTLFELYCPFQPTSDYTSDYAWRYIKDCVQEIETKRWRRIKKIYIDAAPQYLKRLFKR